MRPKTDIIIGVDDDFKGMKGEPNIAFRQRYRSLLTGVCDDFQGHDVQLKMNSGLRVLGHEAIEIVEEAGLEAMLDYKLGPDVLDTMLADIRALAVFTCIRRFTFRVECPVEFLTGRDSEPGARALMPNTSFLPVGPVTDLSEDYYRVRMGLHGGRSEAMRNFGIDVLNFKDNVSEVICSPRDIAYFHAGFWEDRSPVTPAVRPEGLPGNEGNNVNALNVRKAVGAGSSAIIVASPVMRSPDRRKALSMVVGQLREAEEELRHSNGK